METNELIIPNYEEVILHIKNLIEFPTPFSFNIDRSGKYMSVVASPTHIGDKLVTKMNYSELIPVYEANRVYTRLGICMDKAEELVDGLSEVDLIKRYIIVGIIHEFGHIYYMSLAFKYGAHRTFIASRSMNKYMHKAMEYESYRAMYNDGYSPEYLLNPDELHADSFVKDHYDRIMVSLIENGLI